MKSGKKEPKWKKKPGRITRDGNLRWTNVGLRKCKNCRRRKAEHFGTSFYCYGVSNNFNTYK